MDEKFFEGNLRNYFVLVLIGLTLELTGVKVELHTGVNFLLDF